MIKQESITQLKEKIDIVEIVRDYLPNLRRRGKNYFVNCPFHSERTPSFSIAPDKKIVHCFGCGYSGDAIKFVRDIEHISYTEAVEKIAKKLNIKLEYTKFDKEKYDERKTILDALNSVAEYYHRTLLEDKLAAQARTYLALRGIKADTIEKFKLGFAPEGNFIVKNFKDYDLSTLFKAGIINFFLPENEHNENKKYDHPYDYFRERIIFPVFDVSGKIISFGGRVLPESVSAVRDKVPPYLNGPETIVFNKGNNLYGLYQAKDTVVKQRNIIIVEGYMDVLILHQEGIKNVVAPLGTAVTEAQVKLIKRFSDSVCLMFDPDQSGKTAAISASEIIFKNGILPQIVNLPETIDPDEFVLQHGTQKLEELITTPQSVIKFAINHYLKLTGKHLVSKLDTKDKISLLKKLLEIVDTIIHPVIKSDAIKELSEELQINEEIVRSELKKLKKLVRKQSDTNIEMFFNNKPYSCEEEILWLCIHFPDKIHNIGEKVFEHHNEYLNLFRKLKDEYFHHRDIYQIIDNLQSPIKELIIRIAFDSKEVTEPIEKKLDKLFNDIYRIQCNKRYKELKPVVTDMLNGRQQLDNKIINEFKEIVEYLKSN